MEITIHTNELILAKRWRDDVTLWKGGAQRRPYSMPTDRRASIHLVIAHSRIFHRNKVVTKKFCERKP